MSCKSLLQIADYSGNQVTVRCELENGHVGRHRRISTRDGRDGRRGEITISTTPKSQASTMKVVRVSDRSGSLQKVKNDDRIGASREG